MQGIIRREHFTCIRIFKFKVYMIVLLCGIESKKNISHFLFSAERIQFTMKRMMKVGRKFFLCEQIFICPGDLMHSSSGVMYFWLGVCIIFILCDNVFQTKARQRLLKV